MTNTFLIPLPDSGIIISGPQRSGKTTMLYAYLKDLAKRCTGISPEILVICDFHAFRDIMDRKNNPDIPLSHMDVFQISGSVFPDVQHYRTVVFAITLDRFKRSYQQSSDAYNEFVRELNALPRSPYTVIMVDTN